MEDSAARVRDFPIPDTWRKSRTAPEELVRDVGNEQEGEPSEVLQQRLQVVASQREQMQQMEIELRAQIIARSEIADIKKCFDAKVQELRKEETHEKQQNKIPDLQRLVEEKDRELIAVQRDNEVKQRQIIELQEQYRVSQETITSKDEQLRKAQEWLARFQAVDPSQLASLQAELQGHTAQSGEINAPRSHSIQESELQEQIEQQKALPKMSFHVDSQRGKTQVLDECVVSPTSENEVQQDGLGCNHSSVLGGDGTNLGGNLRYKDITMADIVGMQFDSFEAAEDFYRQYAVAIGFSIRKQDLRRKANGVVIMQKWVCNREGRRRQKSMEGDNKHWSRRPITRVGCPASFRINMDSVGKWIVKQAILEHNHELTPPLTLEASFLSDEAFIKREKRLKTRENPDEVGD